MKTIQQLIQEIPRLTRHQRLCVERLVEQAIGHGASCVLDEIDRSVIPGLRLARAVHVAALACDDPNGTDPKVFQQTFEDRCAALAAYRKAIGWSPAAAPSEE